MTKKIYGVDLSKKITPSMVRDAIIRCFVSAQKEVLDQMKEYSTFKSKGEFEKFKRLDIEYLIRSIFTEINGNFDNPTKKDLIAVIDKLAEIASNFRKPKIIKKHYREIMRLINKLE